MTKKMMMMAAALAAAMPLMADTETVGGYTWTYRINGETAEIRNGISPKPTGAVTIPSTLGGKPVTSIGDWAFYECDELTSVTISTSVTNIGYAAFALSGLTHVKIPDSVVNIDSWAFGCCHDLTSVVIGKSVKNIRESAFSDDWHLKDVTIPYGVESIGKNAFGGMQFGCDLTKVIVPASVTNIGELAFWGAEKLRNITLPIWCKTANMDWRSYLGLERTAKITYKDVGGGSSGGDVAEIWKKAQTFNGAVFREGKAVGLIQVKVGKASKKGEVSVSGTITGLDGKKLTAKGGKVAVNGESATVTLAVNGGTPATVTVGKDGISGSWNGATIAMADVGGNWTRTDAKVYVDMDDVPAGTVEELLPDGEPIIPKGGKWSFNKNATVRLSKDKTTYTVDDKKGKNTNLSSMKFTYTPKTGIFKGTFKVYALEGADGKKKLKKYTVNVIGFVVDGKGQGEASCKKPKGGPWTVTVE